MKVLTDRLAARGFAPHLSRIALLAAILFGAAAGAQPGASVGQPAPAFERTALDGAPISLAHLRGKVILLNFWATWCAPCQAEMPIFSTWQRERAAQGLQVIGISMDDDATPVRRLVARMHLSYPIAMGDEQLGARYGGILGLPVSYLIDRQGRIRARFRGETNPARILAALEPLLAKPSTR